MKKVRTIRELIDYGYNAVYVISLENVPGGKADPTKEKKEKKVIYDCFAIHSWL